jgi:hypothetical protein
MSRWDEEYENHRVFPALANARQQLDATSEQLADEAERESHERLVRVCDHVDRVLQTADPELVPPTVLEQLAGNLDQISTNLQQYATTGNRAYLDNANAQADSLLTQAMPLLPRPTELDAEGLQATISSFRRSAGQHLANLERQVTAVIARAANVESGLSEQAGKLQAQDARLDAVVTEFQAQFSSAQEQRQAQFALALEESRSQIRAVVTDGETALDQTEEEATSKVAGLITGLTTDIEATLTDAKEQTAKALEDLRSESTGFMVQLDDLLEKAVKTVGAIGSTGMAGGYKIVADDEKKQADRLRILAILALLGAIGATIFAVAHGVAHGFEVDTFFAKWAISVPFAALASYAAVESSKHRDRATQNRKIELQLASLDTYLVNLDEEQQEAIKAKLADRFFGELPGLPPAEAGHE